MSWVKFLEESKSRVVFSKGMRVLKYNYWLNIRGRNVGQNAVNGSWVTIKKIAELENKKNMLQNLKKVGSTFTRQKYPKNIQIGF
jgi:hypothetical protein